MFTVSSPAPFVHAEVFSFDAVSRSAGLAPRPTDVLAEEQQLADDARAALESDAAHVDFELQIEACRLLTALADRLGRDKFETVVASAAQQLGYPVSFA